MPELTPDAYAATGGTHCPACAGTDLAWGMWGAPTPATHSQEVECRQCQALWTAVYTLTGYEGLRVPPDPRPGQAEARR